MKTGKILKPILEMFNVKKVRYLKDGHVPGK